MNRQDILFDHDRSARIGLPEAVFCEGKSEEALLALLDEHCRDAKKPILFTRLAPEAFAAATLPEKGAVSVAVVSAGTADGRVLWEAARTLRYLGINARVFEDNGVAGLWRLTRNLDAIASAQVVIVVAGLDAALASVMGGLTGKPIFAVPTSVGYGAAKQGETALASMLVSCAPGVGVMNIDNGYGAACAAARVVNLLESERRHRQ